MMRIMREVRFSLVAGELASTPVTNSWAGWPGTDALAPYLALRAIVAGQVEPRTGYVVNIALIDRALRSSAVPMVRRRWVETGGRPLAVGGLMRPLWEVTGARLGELALDGLELRATPHLRFAILPGDPSMVTVTQCFEFAAAHRLFVSGMSDEENRRIFGKCTNPNGHGHNYRLEVTLAGEPDPVSGTLIDLPDFEATVKERVLERFDHKHLNADCEEFATLNPSVENITRVIWELLEGAFARGLLHSVRVWETAKTFAEYRGAV